MLGRAKPIGGVTKTQTSKTQTSDPKKLRPEKLRPLGASKTQTPEQLRPLGVSKKAPTLNIFQILQLTVVREQPLSLSHPQKRMVLQKYRLSENSHWQTISTKPNFWSRAMKFCSTGERFDPSRGNHILDKKGYFGTRVRTSQTNSSWDSHKPFVFLFPVLPVPSTRTLVVQDKGRSNKEK